MNSITQETIDTTTGGTPMTPQTVVLPSGLSEKIHTPIRTLEDWRQKGIGPPYIKIGPKRIGYLWGDVLKWLESQRFNSTSEKAA